MSRKSARLALMCFWLVAGLIGPANSQVRAAELEYNRDIRPILADKCFACHGPDSASRKADLRLDQREAAVEYGAINLEEPQSSSLMERIFETDPELVMPPPETKKPLTDIERNTLAKWIESGAEYQAHWSFIEPADVRVPAVQQTDWVKNEIDNFVLANLEANALAPNPPEEPYRLFRRLHLDITGLLPTTEAVRQFEAEFRVSEDNAISRWIDRLMDSSAWGEHRARYWLDAARYADTHGMHFDNYREMWPYRDWVIRAFNENQPFDEFTIEQLAGDLLPNPSEQQLVATGFQRCNMTTNEGGTIDEENLALYAADRVQTIGWVYLGLTTNCCQCHDHKFDPLTIKDYYSMAAFFRNTEQGPKDGNRKDGLGPVLVIPSEKDRARWEALPKEIEQARADRDQHLEVAKGEFSTWLSKLTNNELSYPSPTESLVLNLALTATTEESKVATDGPFGPASMVDPKKVFSAGDIGNFTASDAFSYGAWIKVGDESASGGIIAKMDEQGNYRGWDLWQQGKQLAVHIIDQWPGNALKVVTKNPVLDGKRWQHAFVTYDGSRKPDGITIYVDGLRVETQVETNALSPTANIQTQVPLRLGGRSHSQIFTGGALQDFRLYSRHLDAAEIARLAGSGLSQAAIRSSAKPDAASQESLLQIYLRAIDPRYGELDKRLISLTSELQEIRDRSPITHVQREKEGTMAKANVLLRGEYDRVGEEVIADTPKALHPFPENAPRNRLGLAKWIVDPQNPLTARVTVNRFWQQLFGTGIVVTAEDFGISGALPSNPELLDYLARDFQQNGWDVKRFFKRVMLSATYRQSSSWTPEKLERDANNQLLSRGPRYRLDAEMIRDCALASSGLLSSKMYGPSVKPYQPVNIWDVVGLPGGDTREYVVSEGEDLYRRSLYTFWKRMAPPPSLEALNAPSREFCTVRRELTNTPLQALVTLNDPQFVEAARKLAELSMLQGKGNFDAVLNIMANRTLARDFSSAEAEILRASYADFHEFYSNHEDDAFALTSVGESKRDPTLEQADLAAWTMIANEILNLDESLTK